MQRSLDSAKENIRVNAICPVVIDTPMFEQDIPPSYTKETYIQTFIDEYPIGRIGRPEEFAFAALMLASDEASFITGVNIPVDGGVTAR